MMNWRAFVLVFNGTHSREELKTVSSGLNEMTLSSQIEFTDLSVFGKLI
jgi:hypothetical protein